MKTYRVHLWSGIDPDRLHACANYIYHACKANREFEFVHAFNNYLGHRYFRSIYISISPSEEDNGEYRINAFITQTLSAYKRITSQNGILFDSIKEIK